jgi:thymidylate kinase
MTQVKPLNIEGVIISKEDFNKLKEHEQINSNLLKLQKELKDGSVVVWDGYYSSRYYYSNVPHYKQLIEEVKDLTNQRFDLNRKLIILQEKLNKIPQFIKIAYKINNND